MGTNADNGNEIQSYCKLGDELFDRGLVQNAFTAYMDAVKKSDHLKESLKEKIVVTLCSLGEVLERKNKLEELFTSYENAIRLYPNCAELYCNLGAHLIRIGEFKSGYCYFLKSLKEDEDYLPAYSNLHTTLSKLIDRWHFRMLNDSLRNKTYKNAIARKIRQKFNSVLDIGTGTGLLSIYASANNNKTVYACDCSDEMICIAEAVFMKNSMSQKVVLIDKLSNDIIIPDDIPSRVSLVITETMDCGLLGERILQTLHHAWEHLLLPPMDASKFENSKMKNDGKHGVVIPFGASLWVALVECERIKTRFLFSGASRETYKNSLSLAGLNLYHSVNDYEPYDTEKLRSVPRKFLSASKKLFAINFNDPANIAQYMNGKNVYSDTIKCAKGGQFHAVVAWFEIQVDEHLKLSTSPFTESCWDQAIFPLKSVVDLKPDDVVDLKYSCNDGILALSATKKTIVDSPSEQKEFMPVPQAIVRILNDIHLLKAFDSTARAIAKKINNLEKDNISVLDLSAFPYLGLSILLYLDEKYWDKCSLTCKYESIRCALECAKENNLPGDIRFMDETQLDKMFLDKESRYDFIILDLIEDNGLLNEHVMLQLSVIKDSLKSDGILIPQSLDICAQIIESDELQASAKVLEEEMVRLHIADAINLYWVPQQLDIEIFKTKHTGLSEPFVCMTLNLSDLVDRYKCRKKIKIVRNGSAAGVFYWYDVALFDNIKYSTNNEQSFVSQGAFVYTDPIVATKNKVILQDFTYHGSLFRIDANKARS